MSLNRITSGLMSNQSIHALSLNMGILSKIQQKMSSGKNILNPSDDPIGLTRVVDLSNQLRTDERYARNINDALSEVTTTDKAMTSVVELIQRAQELTTQAANVSQNQDGRSAIMLEVDQIINQLVQLGNTQVNGKYIFAGSQTDTPPFVRSGTLTEDITYSGNSSYIPPWPFAPPPQLWPRNAEIAQGIELTLNIAGDDLLGYVDMDVPLPPPPPTIGDLTFALDPADPAPPASRGLLKTLMQLRVDLYNDNVTGIRNTLDLLDTDLNNVLAKQAVIGSAINRLELTKGRIEERKAILTQQYASIQDIDMPKTIADLNHQQNIMQASLGVTARLLQTSLLDFLR